MKTFANSVLVILILFFFATAFLSCEKPQSYSEVPEISFKSYRVFDTLISSYEDPIRMLEIKFNFVDGDGDFGYDPQVPEDTIDRKSVV